GIFRLRTSSFGHLTSVPSSILNTKLPFHLCSWYLCILMSETAVTEKLQIENLDPREYIIIKNARVNNLKSLSVAIPRNKLVVVTGLSGSGKSSLAFDTLFAEGQRMYVES